MSYTILDDKSARLDTGEIVSFRFMAERLDGGCAVVGCSATCGNVKVEARHTVPASLLGVHGIDAWMREMMLRTLGEPHQLPEAAVDEHVRASHSIRHALAIEAQIASWSLA